MGGLFVRERINLNRGWEFTDRFDEAFLSGAPTPGLENAELPHCGRMLPFDYFDESAYQMVCGYRRRLVPAPDWAGKRIFLRVGAAAHSAEVFLDGVKLGEHRCGYTAFDLELTGRLSPGREALLVIRLDSRESQDIPPFGYVIDYMTYCGLYREVWLELTAPAYIADVFAMADDRGRVTGAVTLGGDAPSGARLRQRVFLPQAPETVLAEAEFAPGETVALTVPDARLWDTESPTLYTLRTELTDGGAVVDRLDTDFGFRGARWQADGFYLNGKKVKLLGLNRHQSYPYIGYAAPRSLQRLDADILKFELGLNAVRTSHYPQSPHFLRRCDEIGLLVFTEIPGWQHIGGPAWQDQAVANTEEMVLQYRNHPSVILWGVRINESADNDALYRRTNEAARRLDPTRATGGVRCHKKSHLLEDVYTYNDFLHDGKNPGCEKKKAVTGDRSKAYLVTEYNGHMFPAKTYDSEEHRLEHALRHANVLDAVAAEEDIAGSFGWCMADYNTHRDFGSGDRICYHGVLDMFRNPKTAAWVYAARRESPLLAVSSSMDIGEHPAGNRGRVFVFTNADSVRLYKNDVFIRAFTHADSPYRHLPRPPIEIDDYLGDQVAESEPFTPAQARLVKELLNHSARFGSSRLPPGMLLRAGWLMLRYRMDFAAAYALYGKYIGDWGKAATVYRFEAIKDGRVVQTVTRGPVLSVRLEAAADHTVLREDGTYDAALIRLRATDQDGNVLPFFQGAVWLEAAGAIALLGPEEAVLRGGLGGAFVKTVGQTGAGTLTLSCAGMEPVSLEFTVQAASEGGA